jgi:hemerythrin-like domain-containing protein/quercetin dioxygenase-like cupin family protein
VKRHPALVPLSHDHHHGLVQARRLRRAAGGSDEASRVRAAKEFAAFFGRETAEHFREEEALLFPLLAGRSETAQALLAETALQHAEIRALVARLERSLAAGTVDAELLAELGALLESHIRLEERQLFPLAEQLVPAEELDALSLPERAQEPVVEGSPVVNLAAGSGRGPLWGAASEDLNATLVAWRAEETTPEQANDERDVLLVGIEGTGEVRIEGEAHAFGPARTVIVPKGTTLQIAAGADGLRYLSVHLRKPGLQIAGLA